MVRHVEDRSAVTQAMAKAIIQVQSSLESMDGLEC